MWRLQFRVQKKSFQKNSSLVTLNAVSCWDIEAYSANSPYATRHPNRCMLLSMCMLYAQFTLRSLVTLKSKCHKCFSDVHDSQFNSIKIGKAMKEMKVSKVKSKRGVCYSLIKLAA